MIKNYFKTAWRSLWNNKSTTAINIIGLAVGMTAAIFIFLWVQNELSFDSNNNDSNRIYRLTSNLPAYNFVWETAPLLLADAVKKEVPGVEITARLNDSNWPVIDINNTFSYEKKCAYVDNDWFTLFHYDFIEGNVVAFAEDPNSIILTESAAKKYFGKADALGATIHVDSMNYVVKAIVADAPSNSSFQYNAFIPLQNLLKDAGRRANDEQWQNANYITFIKVAAGTNPTLLSKKITAVYDRNSGDKESSITLLELQQMHFDSSVQNSVFSHGNKSTIYIFTILGILLLVIACINYVNLTTAKASLRAKEVSIRKMAGATRQHLFYQFITESLLISIIALMATILLIHFCLPAFNQATDKHFELPLTSLSIWKVASVTLLAAFILNSIYPAIVLSSFSPLLVFRGYSILKIKDSFFRKGLVTLQFTISVLLIAVTFIINRQMKFIEKSDPGYNRSQLLSIPVPPGYSKNREAIMQAIKQDLLSKSCIQNVTLSNQSIVDVGSFSSGSADWNGRDTTFNPKIAQLAVDADFANTMQLRMKEGRWFQQGNGSDKNNVVLNEAAIKELNIPAPVIGQRFTFKERTGQIIGVVNDFKYKSMHDKTGPLIAFEDPAWFHFFTVRVSPGRASKAVQAIQTSWTRNLPGKPLEYNFLDQTFNELYKEDQQASLLIFVFAVVAVFISCLGLFGLASFTTAQRSKEIGIRKVLGASVARIAQMVTKDFLMLVIVAIFIALPVSWLVMSKWLQAFAFRINLSWWMFAAAGCIAIFIALATVSYQAIKAAIANPVKSLKVE